MSRRGALAVAALLLAACATTRSAPATEQPAAAPAAAAAAPPALGPDDERWQLSYVVGYGVGNNLQQAGAYLDRGALNQGLEDIWQHRAPRLGEDDMRQAMNTVASQLRNPHPASIPPDLELAKRYSYAVGVTVASRLMGAQDRFDLLTLEQAIGEANAGLPSRVDQATRQKVSDDFRAYIEQRRQKTAADNQAESDAFLAANRSKAGVTVTASGLQYEVLQAGQGPHPVAASRVRVYYAGRLLNGEVFDESRRHSQDPVSFPLNAVIAGWTEGMQLMQAGARYRFYVPPQLAYGEHGAPPAIGPNQVLVFEVELVSFQ